MGTPQDILAGIEGIRVKAALPTHEGGGRNTYTGAAAREQLLRLVAAGMQVTEAGKSMQLDPRTIRKWLCNPEYRFKERLKEINADAYAALDAELAFRAKATHEKLYQAADEALDTVIDLMRGADSEVIRFRASQDLMDRRPDTSKVHRVDKRSVNVNIDSKWLEAAAQVEAEEGNTING